MSQQDYFIEFARELGDLNGNIKSVLSRLEKGDGGGGGHHSRGGAEGGGGGED